MNRAELKKQSAKSQLEASLAMQIRAVRLPEPLREHEFATSIGRNWRWDFCWLHPMLAVEIQGGIWKDKSGHNTGVGITRDCAKFSNGTLLGWHLILATGEQVESGEAIKWIQEFFARAA